MRIFLLWLWKNKNISKNIQVLLTLDCFSVWKITKKAKKNYKKCRSCMLTQTHINKHPCSHTPWSVFDCICWILKVCDNLRGSKRIKPLNDYTEKVPVDVGPSLLELLPIAAGLYTEDKCQNILKIKTTKNKILNPQSNLKRLSRSPKQTLKTTEASVYSISSWREDAGLHMGAVIMAALDWLPAPKRNKPQEFPASAAHVG